MNFHGNGLNLKQRLLYTLNLMIFSQGQNFAARWLQWGVLIVASIVRNHINSLEQLVNHNIHIDMSACRQFLTTYLNFDMETKNKSQNFVMTFHQYIVQFTLH